jgi:lactoylglutathione lyase
LKWRIDASTINDKEGDRQMKIEHIAMYVKDLKTARDFFVAYLGGKPNDGYHNPRTGFRSFFISFDDGARLELMNKSEMDDLEKPLGRTGYVHIAFSVGSKERVDELSAGQECPWFSVRVSIVQGKNVH